VVRRPVRKTGVEWPSRCFYRNGSLVGRFVSPGLAGAAKLRVSGYHSWSELLVFSKCFQTTVFTKKSCNTGRVIARADPCRLWVLRFTVSVDFEQARAESVACAVQCTVLYEVFGLTQKNTASWHLHFDLIIHRKLDLRIVTAQKCPTLCLTG
jgi:hypothetical protein